MDTGSSTRSATIQGMAPARQSSVPVPKHIAKTKDNEMLKPLAAALAIAAALATGAMAADAPKDADECLKKAIDLAESAEEKKLGDDKLAKIEDLLTKLEGHCEASQFTEAATVSTDIEAVIAGK